jgi:hypothetical protein
MNTREEELAAIKLKLDQLYDRIVRESEVDAYYDKRMIHK